MTALRRGLRALAFLAIFCTASRLHAQYERILLRVNGMDCELCARGVAASVHRLTGVRSVDVSLKRGELVIVLMPGNSFKMSDLRKRIRDNGLRAMEAKVTAVGRFDGPRFVVLGSGESYEVGRLAEKNNTSVELTFDTH